jgi:hypothetical protein
MAVEEAVAVFSSGGFVIAYVYTFRFCYQS